MWGSVVLLLGAGGPEPPRLKLMTDDYLYNMTSRNISDWLMKTTHNYRGKRFVDQFVIGWSSPYITTQERVL